MAQLLKVIQDPSIVQNVPTTSLEQLQIATEAKAAQMAAAQAKAEAVTKALIDSTPYDVQNDPAYPVSAGYKMGTWAKPDATQNVAIRPPATVDAANALDVGQLGLTNDPFRTKTSAQKAIEAEVAKNGFEGVIAALTARNRTPQPFGGTVGSLNGRGFLSGNHGTTDWSVANQGMGGLGGLVTQSTLTPTAAPAPNAGFNLLSLFGGGYTPTVGYNGTTTVTSDELAGANKGFGGENAVMPDSMNSKRWETGY